MMVDKAGGSEADAFGRAGWLCTACTLGSVPCPEDEDDDVHDAIYSAVHQRQSRGAPMSWVCEALNQNAEWILQDLAGRQQ